MNKLAPFVLLALAACGDDAPAMENPDVLWLALDGRETQVKLIAEEPRPY